MVDHRSGALNVSEEVMWQTSCLPEEGGFQTCAREQCYDLVEGNEGCAEALNWMDDEREVQYTAAWEVEGVNEQGWSLFPGVCTLRGLDWAKCETGLRFQSLDLQVLCQCHQCQQAPPAWACLLDENSYPSTPSNCFLQRKNSKLFVLSLPLLQIEFERKNNPQCNNYVRSVRHLKTN